MEGARNIFGKRTSEFTVDGKTYTLSPRTLDNYAERESYICSLKPHPLQVIEGLPPLPPAPELVPPLQAVHSQAERAEHARKLAAYQTAKERHDSLVKQRKQLEDRAWAEANRPRVATFEDVNRFDQSWHGYCYGLWMSLRDNHPELDSVQDVMDLLEHAKAVQLEEVSEALAQAEEKDLLGNSTPAAGEGSDVGQLGDGSLPLSPLDTGGAPTQSAS